MDLPLIALAGAGIGLVFGVFGAGGSAFATPVLAIMGVPAVLAVASPLPALLPASVAGASHHLRDGTLDRRSAVLAVAGGAPGAVLGGLASSAFGGSTLLLLSGIVLLVVGARVSLPDSAGSTARAAARRNRSKLIVGGAFAVGLLTGLLANGGGFLLVPLFILGFGLSPREAAGTSMVAIGALAIPTLMAHWALGHIDWSVAATFAAGVVPASMAGVRLAEVIPARAARWTFGLALVAFSAWFLVRQLG